MIINMFYAAAILHFEFWFYIYNIKKYFSKITILCGNSVIHKYDCFLF